MSCAEQRGSSGLRRCVARTFLPGHRPPSTGKVELASAAIYVSTPRVALFGQIAETLAVRALLRVHGIIRRVVFVVRTPRCRFPQAAIEALVFPGIDHKFVALEVIPGARQVCAGTFGTLANRLSVTRHRIVCGKKKDRRRKEAGHIVSASGPRCKQTGGNAFERKQGTATWQQARTTRFTEFAYRESISANAARALPTNWRMRSGSICPSRSIPLATSTPAG